MAAAAFNPLEYAHRLEKAGMPQKLAEVQAQAQFEIIHSLVENHAVTKQDIKDLRQDVREIRKDIEALRRDLGAIRQETSENANSLRQEMTENINSLRQEIAENTNSLRQEIAEKTNSLRQEVKSDMIILRKDLTIRLGLMMSSSLFILVTLMKLFHL